MPSTVVVGAQWGDEGKGKIIDILASRADVVVRSQGGNNAGHTVKAGEEVYKLSLIPSGILYPGTLCLLGNGVVLNPPALLEEMDGLAARGISLNDLRIDARAHIVLPYHLVQDEYSERARGAADIGTTKRGIGPCYMDKAERSGIRLCDMLDEALFETLLARNCETKNKQLSALYGAPPVDAAEIFEAFRGYARRLAPYVADTGALAYDAIKAGKNVLFEGAQGTLLDLDLGTYPYVTSSHPTSGGACVGAGIGPTLIGSCLGVAKAYTTRVGKGPFPTELFDATGDLIREKGFEFGTVTGRARRCGWLDAVMLRYAVRVNGLTALSINKLDTLSGVGPLQICVAYELDGKRIDNFPPSLAELERCTPVFETLQGFDGDLSGVRSFDALPAAAKDYVAAIERLCGCPVVMVGVGPGRDQNIER